MEEPTEDADGVSEEARLAIETSCMAPWQKQQALDDLINDGEAVIQTIDHDRVALDIANLKPKSAVPFLAGVVVAGLMILPDNLQPAIYNIKQHNIELDNFEVLCVFFARNDKLRDVFLKQTADYASTGVWPEGPDQEGWNESEFEIVISLLRLTLKP
jgi:hypothetical protein